MVDLSTGEAIGSTTGSTTKLNTEGFAIYLDKIIAWLADYGIEVPEASRSYIGA